MFLRVSDCWEWLIKHESCRGSLAMTCKPVSITRRCEYTTTSSSRTIIGSLLFRSERRMYSQWWVCNYIQLTGFLVELKTKASSNTGWSELVLAGNRFFRSLIWICRLWDIYFCWCRVRVVAMLWCIFIIPLVVVSITCSRSYTFIIICSCTHLMIYIVLHISFDLCDLLFTFQWFFIFDVDFFVFTLC